MSSSDSNGAEHTGLGKGFALTPEQQRVAGIGDAPVRKGVHPDGVEGTKFSLQEMSKAIQGDLKDPKTVVLLRGWGGRALLAAGNPTNESTQAQAILDAVRKRTVYVQDPINTEMIVKPKTTLCLEDGKLCIPAADCDDRIVAYCAVLMSLGIDCRFIAQAFGTERATHVICAFRDPAKGWVRVDPSAKDWPVGKYHPATKEWWMDPTSGSLTMGGADGFPVSLGKEPEHGDFIGVGAVPEGLPEGLGVFPFAHAFSPLSHGAAYAPVGLQEGEWPPYPVTLDQVHAMGLGDYPSAHAFSPEAGAGTNAYSPIPVGLGHDLVAEVERVIGMGQAYDYPYTVILGPAGTNGMDGYVGPYGYDQNTTAGDLGQGVQDALNAGPQVPIPQPQPLDASVVTWLAVGAVAVASIVVVGPLVWEWIAERRLSRAMHHGAK
jgi:hypothetical protein